MTSRLSVFNGALRFCGERKLLTVTDNRPARHYLDEAFDDDFINECLESMEWQFATRTISITYSPSIDTNDIGFQYAFNKPEDWRRSVVVSSDPAMRFPLVEFWDRGGYWFANYDTLYVAYISNDNAYGNDLSLWPAKFTQWASCKLALRIIERLSQNASKKESLEEDLKRLFKEARGQDGASEPLKFPPQGRWASARVGRH
jgi:hypothetical protein